MRKVYKKLSYNDRKIIERMKEQGKAAKEIASKTGVPVATIYRELDRGADKEGKYKAEIAQKSLFS